MFSIDSLVLDGFAGEASIDATDAIEHSLTCTGALISINDVFVQCIGILDNGRVLVLVGDNRLLDGQQAA